MYRYRLYIISQICAHRLHHTSPYLRNCCITFVADLLTCSMIHGQDLKGKVSRDRMPVAKKF